MKARRVATSIEQIRETRAERDQLHEAIGRFLDGDECDTDECREKGYCVRCVATLENSYDDIKEQS